MAMRPVDKPASSEPAPTTVPKSVGQDNGGGYNAPAYLQHMTPQLGNPASEAGDKGTQRASDSQGGESTQPAPPANGNTPFPISPPTPVTAAPAPSIPAPSSPSVTPNFTPYIPPTDAGGFGTPPITPTAPVPTPPGVGPIPPIDNGPEIPPTFSPPPPGFGTRQPGEPPISAPEKPLDGTPWVPTPTDTPPGEPSVPQPKTPPLGDLPPDGTPPTVGPPANPTDSPVDWNTLGAYLMKLLQNPSVYDDQTFKDQLAVQKGDLQDQLDSDQAQSTANFAERGLVGGSNLPVDLDKLATQRDRTLGQFTTNLAAQRAQTMSADRQTALSGVFGFLNAAAAQQGIDLDWARLAQAIGSAGAPDQNGTPNPGTNPGGIDPAIWAAIAGFINNGKKTTTNSGTGTVTGSNPFPND